MNRGNGQPSRETVKVSRGEVDIDVLLARLMSLVWKRGIETFQFCQEARPGEACIEVATGGDVERFLNVAQRQYNVEIETWDQGDEGERDIRVRLLVFFPTKDIARLVKQFQKALAC